MKIKVLLQEKEEIRFVLKAESTDITNNNFNAAKLLLAGSSLVHLTEVYAKYRLGFLKKIWREMLRARERSCCLNTWAVRFISGPLHIVFTVLPTRYSVIGW